MLTMTRLSANERMDASVNKTDTCWLWTGSLDTAKYGQIMVGGRMRKAHTAFYERYVGPVPEGLELDHLCRVRLCVNPEHLEAVTHAENVRRAALARTTCPNGHQYDSMRDGHRSCSTCRRAQIREAGARFRAAHRPEPRDTTRCARGHVYDRWENGKPRCRTCKNDRARERYAGGER